MCWRGQDLCARSGVGAHKKTTTNIFFLPLSQHQLDFDDEFDDFPFWHDRLLLPTLEKLSLGTCSMITQTTRPKWFGFFFPTPSWWFTIPGRIGIEWHSISLLPQKITERSSCQQHYNCVWRERNNRRRIWFVALAAYIPNKEQMSERGDEKQNRERRQWRATQPATNVFEKRLVRNKKSWPFWWQNQSQ